MTAEFAFTTTPDNARRSPWPRRLRRWGVPLLVAGVSAGVAVWAYVRINREAREAARQLLETVLRADLASLKNWFSEQEDDIRVLARDAAVVDAVRSLRAAADPDRSEPAAALRRRLTPIARGDDYIDYVVADAAGRVLTASRPGLLGPLPEAYQLGRLGAARGPRFLIPRGRVARWPGRPSLLLVAPVIGGGEAVGYVGFRIDPEREFSDVVRVARFGRTGETYAFDAAGVMVTESRFEGQLREIGLLPPGGDSAFALRLLDPEADLTAGGRMPAGRFNLRLTKPVRSAVYYERGLDVDGYRDYRGVTVVGAWTWLNDYDIGLVTEIDKGEAYASVGVLRRAYWLLGGVLAVLAAAVIVGNVWLGRLARRAASAEGLARRLGRYRLLGLIGTGGMGEVYRASHMFLRRPTAVKLMRPDRSADAAALARFEREARLTSQLTHPNTITVYDFGRAADGRFYYAMELLRGLNLAELVGRWGPLPDGRAAFVLAQACASLHEAHAAGFVHRDVKPSNIFLCRLGGMHDVVKVLDFGLVFDRAAGGDVTAPGAVLGTPLYMPPEAVRPEAAAEPRRDIYAVGATGYYLLTGRHAHLVTRDADDPPPPSALIGRTVDAALEALIMRCLAADPARRPGSAAGAADGLRRCPAFGDWGEARAEQWWDEHPGLLTSLDSTPEVEVEPADGE